MPAKSNWLLIPSLPISASWRPWQYGDLLGPPLPAAVPSMARKLLSLIVYVTALLRRLSWDAARDCLPASASVTALSSAKTTPARD
jgi:hypothetical protein